VSSVEWTWFKSVGFNSISCVYNSWISAQLYQEKSPTRIKDVSTYLNLAPNSTLQHWLWTWDKSVVHSVLIDRLGRQECEFLKLVGSAFIQMNCYQNLCLLDSSNRLNWFSCREGTGFGDSYMPSFWTLGDPQDHPTGSGGRGKLKRSWDWLGGRFQERGRLSEAERHHEED